MISVCRCPIVSHIQRFNFRNETTPATKYISSMFSSYTPSRDQAFPFLWFSKTLEYKKITKLKRRKRLQPCSVLPLPCVNRNLLFKQTNFQQKLSSGRTYEKRVQSTSNISQTVHHFQQIPHESGKWGSSAKNPCPRILIFALACAQFTAENRLLKNDGNPALFCFVH